MHTRLIEDITHYVQKELSGLQGHLYHHFGHALEISGRSVEIAQKEGLNDHDQEILAIAGLFHDIGFSEQYEKNEPLGALHAKRYLENISYPPQDIVTIYRIILATDIDLPANDLLEKIIKDADIDNLGRDDFWEKGEWLHQEIIHIYKKDISQLDWYKSSLQLMKNSRFLTRTNQIERTPQKEKNTLLLEQKIRQLS